MDISATGQSAPVVVRTGIHVINIDGANFGGTSVRIDWRQTPADVWSPLNDEDGLPIAATSTYNKSVFTGAGEISFFLTGGAAIDLSIAIERLPA